MWGDFDPYNVVMAENGNGKNGNGNEQAAAGGPPGLLRDRYAVLSAQPLSDLSSLHADAYVAEDRREPGRRLFALVVKPGMPARVPAIRVVKGLSLAGMLQLVEWGPMMWPLANRQCMTLIYERPLGQRLMPNLRAEIPRISENDIGKRIIDPILAVLREFSSKGVTHRAIRPTNLFLMTEAGDRIALGDGISGPPGLEQPALFESVESAMCSPQGRGPGTEFDDMYALGATIGILLHGRIHPGHLDDDQVLRNKLEYGSYGTIVGDMRLPLPLVELLRGLLCDDVNLRWSVEALEMWSQGLRLSPIQSRQEKRAPRGFPFQGRDYLTPRELAAGFARQWDLAIPVVLEGKLELWLRRALEDKERAEIVADMVRTVLAVPGERAPAEHVMLARVLMLLDPGAPIRFRGFNVMPDGLGIALAVQMSRRQDCNLIADLISRDLVKDYFTVHGGNRSDPLIENNFREIKGMMTQSGTGFGLERVLYEMNDVLPCQSPLVGDSYVVEMKDLLPALDRYGASKGTAEQWPVDRHIAAFIGARARSDVDRNLAAVGESDQNKALMALLNLMAVFQYRLGPESLPGLADWVVKLATTMVSGYHSREKRKEFETILPKLARKGSVVEIYQLLDDPTSREKDSNDFIWAQAQYMATEEEIKRVVAADEDILGETSSIGKQVAAVTGIMIGILSLTISVILKLW